MACQYFVLRRDVQHNNTICLTSCSANTSGLLFAGVAPVYLAMVPLSTYITKPDSVVQKLVEAAIGLIPGGTVSSDRMIPALAVLYTFWTFGGSGAVSAAGLAASRSGA